MSALQTIFGVVVTHHDSIAEERLQSVYYRLGEMQRAGKVPMILARAMKRGVCLGYECLHSSHNVNYEVLIYNLSQNRLTECRKSEEFTSVAIASIRIDTDKRARHCG